MRRYAIAFALCLAPSVFAVQCGSTTIRNAADADALRKSCSTVNGTVTLSLDSNEDISLDGIQVITGDFNTGNCSLSSYQSPKSLGSSTLTSIQGDLMVGSCAPVVNITFPNLQTVVGGFDIVDYNGLSTLDITKLDSVGYFMLRAPLLTAMLHNELRNVTGAHSTQQVYVDTSLASVNSLFRNPLDIGDSLASINSRSLGKQIVANLTFGFARAGTLDINTGWGTFVTLGGSQTTTMSLTNLTLRTGAAGLARNPELASLTVDNVTLLENEFTNVLLPIDHMSNLGVYGGDNLTRLELPPQAVNYTNFSLTVQLCPKLNLSDQFTTNADGTTRQTWYWPQKDMNHISIVVENVATPFFQSWFDYEGNFTNTTGRPVINSIELLPTNKYLLSCAPFEKLFEEGVIKTKNVVCYSSLAITYLRFTQATWGLMLIATGFNVLLLL
ncbi:hypothetical protein V8C35DRAFT_318251 [Trichoderma chlorosporum]